MKLKTIVSALAASMMLAAPAAVKIGEVGDDFTSSREYAKKYNVPIVVTWGNTSCGYCNTLAKTVNGSAKIQSWIAEHKILFVEKHEDYGCQDKDYLDAEEWIQSLKGKTGNYPHMGIYWQKSDGTVAANAAFTAHKNKMPVSTPKNDFEAQIIGTLNQYIGDYKGGDTPEPEPPAESGDASFVTADTADDRLEATADTKVVYVPLTRETADKAAGNKLAVTYPDGTANALSVSWKAGESNLSVAVEMPAKFTVGKTVKLTLKETDGTTIDSSAIALVDSMENLPINPHWVGEYTAKTLPYGEWTMDFDTAKEKVRLYGGKLVAMFGGPLWCPNCVAIEDDVFSTKKFKTWAKKEKLVLVHFDQGQASSPSTPQGTPRGRLLTLTQSTKGKSGASYLSRHGIDPYSSTVKGVIDRVTYLTDAWLAPETTAARLANPVVLLLNDEGTDVDARFARQSEGYTMDLTENMYRLQDLITLGGDDEDKGYLSVTPLTLAAGASDVVAYHLNSRKIAYRLTGVKAGDYVQATVSSVDKNAQEVTLSLVNADGDTIATGKGRVVTAEPVSAAEAEELYLMTESYLNVQATFYGKYTSFLAAVSAVAGDEEMVKTVAFDSIPKAEQKTLNPELYKKQSATVPIYKPLGNEGNVLVGTLAVSVTAANKISAKFSGVESVSFSGTWVAISQMTGAVSTELSKSGVILSLTMDAEGSFSANLTSNGPVWGNGECAAGDLSAYLGNYTVTLVDADEMAGTGYLTVKVTKAGKATVSGTMPDGTSVSVSTVLSPNADGTATLPVYKVTKSGTLSLALSVDAYAKATWGDKGNMDTVREVPGCLCWWDGEASEEVRFEVYGGYWESGTTPLEICEEFELSDELDVVVGGDTNDVVIATKKGFTVTKKVLTALTFAKATGVFSGKAALNVDGKSVQATVKGVLLPGWIDCGGGCGGEPVVERPYGSGTLYYKDGKTTVSMPIDLVAESAE